MAGEWIKMRADLHDDPAVFRLSTLLKTDKFSVIGRLHTFWSWVDRHSVDGRVDGAASTYVDEVVRQEGFADALVVVGWLVVDETGISVPKFDRHNGDSAKNRAQKSERQARWRANKGDSVVVGVDAKPSTQAPTREEKRREEKENPHASVEGLFYEFWAAYPKKDSKKTAMKAYLKINPDAALHARILGAVLAAKESRDWTKDNGQYIPLAASWLNAERWEDQGTAAAKSDEFFVPPGKKYVPGIGFVDDTP